MVSQLAASLPKVEEIEHAQALRKLPTFIPAVTPRYLPPHHLRRLTERLELAAKGIPQFVVCHAPPRHSKTETLVHFPAFALKRNPRLTIGYATYGQRLTRSSSNKIRRIAGAAGITLESATVGEWRNPEGGGVLSTSVGGPLTGYGVDIMLIDDPYKNRIDAESLAYRERVKDWYNDVVFTRIEPGGSIFLFMTRWHPEDLSGYLINERGFDYVQLPAITTDAEGLEHSLWPERWSLEAMQAKRAGTHAYTWDSLFQGNPRPRGQRVFGDAHTFTEEPIVYRSAFGVDLSYTSKTTSDHSVAVEMRKQGKYFYIANCVRRQVKAPEFKTTCYALHIAQPAAPWLWYASGTELGSADFFLTGDEPVPLVATAPKGDKFTRALAYAAAWNAGLVLLPEKAPWLADFVAEHAGFTGVGDKHDDIIDAAVAAFDQLDDKSAGQIKAEPTMPTRREGLSSMTL